MMVDALIFLGGVYGPDGWMTAARVMGVGFARLETEGRRPGRDSPTHQGVGGVASVEPRCVEDRRL